MIKNGTSKFCDGDLEFPAEVLRKIEADKSLNDFFAISSWMICI